MLPFNLWQGSPHQETLRSAPNRSRHILLRFPYTDIHRYLFTLTYRLNRMNQTLSNTVPRTQTWAASQLKTSVFFFLSFSFFFLAMQLIGRNPHGSRGAKVHMLHHNSMKPFKLKKCRNKSIGYIGWTIRIVSFIYRKLTYKNLHFKRWLYWVHLLFCICILLYAKELSTKKLFLFFTRMLDFCMHMWMWVCMSLNFSPTVFLDVAEKGSCSFKWVSLHTIRWS